MNLKELSLVKNISRDGVATMLLYSGIGRDKETGKGVDGEEFANQLYALQDYTETKKINVRINSTGGSVMDGFSIFSAIQNSKIKVDTYIDGMAASIAGVIAMAGRKCYMADIGMLMIHDPAVDSKEVKSSKDKEILNLIKDSLCTTLTNRTGFSKNSMDIMMSKETWMNANDALKNGFVDEIFTTNLKAPKVEPSLTNAAKLYTIYNNALNQPKQMTTISKLLGLQNEASEDSIAIAISKLQTAINEANATIATLKTEKDTLQTKITSIEAEANIKLEAEVTELVENAVKLNKITNEEKDSWTKLAKVDLSAVRNAFEAMGKSTTATKVTDAIKKSPTTKVAADRASWTAREWDKNDPKGWAALKVSNQSEFARIYKETYGTDFKF